MSQLKFRKIHI